MTANTITICLVYFVVVEQLKNIQKWSQLENLFNSLFRPLIDPLCVKMRARNVKRSEAEYDQYSDQDVTPKTSTRFDPELGTKLAFMSLLSLLLSSSSGIWLSLLSSQPIFVSLGLSVLHLGFSFSLGQSFLPRHFSVWAHASLLGLTLTSGTTFPMSFITF